MSMWAKNAIPAHLIWTIVDIWFTTYPSLLVHVNIECSLRKQRHWPRSRWSFRMIHAKFFCPIDTLTSIFYSLPSSISVTLKNFNYFNFFFLHIHIVQDVMIAKVWAIKVGLTQKYAISKKSTIFIQLSWYSTKIIYQWASHFAKISAWLEENCRSFTNSIFLSQSYFLLLMI